MLEAVCSLAMGGRCSAFKEEVEVVCYEGKSSWDPESVNTMCLETRFSFVLHGRQCLRGQTSMNQSRVFLPFPTLEEPSSRCIQCRAERVTRIVAFKRGESNLT